MRFHKKLAQGGWQKLSLAHQLANIGSEISRARYWEEKQDLKSRKIALERALELCDLTLTDKRWKNRLKEIARLREVICDIYQKTGFYNISLEALKNYCFPFGLIARKQ